MVVKGLIVIAGWALLGPSMQALTSGQTVSNPSLPEDSIQGEVKVKPCTAGEDCNDMAHSFCNISAKVCECQEHYQLFSGEKDCLQVSRSLNESCVVSYQCRSYSAHTMCDRGICRCATGLSLKPYDNGTYVCEQEDDKTPFVQEFYVDPTMLGVLAGLIVMFIIMCIVLRMFSKARFREQRTIFNSPRMMKVSLSKGRADRRPSHASVAGSRPGSRAGSRAGSRNPSIQSGLNNIHVKSPTHSKSDSHESLMNSTLKPNAPLAKDDDTPSVKVESPKSPKDANTMTIVDVSDKTITAV